MQEIARRGRVQVNMTVTTDDDRVRRNYEPGCPSIAARLKAVQEIAERGVQTCITMTPMLPLRDPESFAAALLETGTRRFILQPFHLEDRGRERFVGPHGPERHSLHRQAFRLSGARGRAALHGGLQAKRDGAQGAAARAGNRPGGVPAALLSAGTSKSPVKGNFQQGRPRLSWVKAGPFPFAGKERQPA